MPIPFALQSYQSRSLPVSAQRVVNFYAEQAPQDAKSPIYLIGTPGLEEFADQGTGPVRGMIQFGDYLYAVVDTSLYRIGPDGSSNVAATGIPATGDILMSVNPDQLFILVGTAGYIFNGTTLTLIADADLQPASSVCFLDGYFITTISGTAQFQISSLNDGTAWDALDVATAEGAPDNLIRGIQDHRELWLFGEKTTEVWYNSGAADFPLARVESGFIERGLIGKFAVTQGDNSLWWVGDDRIIYRANGFQPARVSTHAIEKLLEDATDLSTVKAFSYSQEGHTFIGFTLEALDGEPESGFTFVYDASTSLWHERESYDLSFWRPNFYAYVYREHLFGDTQSGKIFEASLDAYDDDGEPIVRTATSAPMHGNGKRMTVGTVEVEVESGVGLTTGQGSDPQLVLDWSDDGGRTFSNYLSRSMGAIGATKQRVRFTRTGSFRQRVWRIRVSDPVKSIIIGANP